MPESLSKTWPQIRCLRARRSAANFRLDGSQRPSTGEQRRPAITHGGTRRSAARADHSGMLVTRAAAKSPSRTLPSRSQSPPQCEHGFAALPPNARAPQYPPARAAALPAPVFSVQIESPSLLFVHLEFAISHLNEHSRLNQLIFLVKIYWFVETNNDAAKSLDCRPQVIILCPCF
jgi:hypothetical protein